MPWKLVHGRRQLYAVIAADTLVPKKMILWNRREPESICGWDGMRHWCCVGLRVYAYAMQYSRWRSPTVSDALHPQMDEHQNRQVEDFAQRQVNWAHWPPYIGSACVIRYILTWKNCKLSDEGRYDELNNGTQQKYRKHGKKYDRVV